MNIAHSAAALEAFLNKIIGHSTFQLSEVNFSEQSEWAISNGALSHRSRGYFHVAGIVDDRQKEHLMLYQPQSALTGLAICIKDGMIYILLQARIEPGNVGIGQFGPTIQSTPANFLALHGGKPTAYLNLFYDYCSYAKPLSVSMQLDLGERYFQKSKWHHYVLVSDFLETEYQMVWASMGAIMDTLGKDNFHNTDLRSLLAVFDWDMLQLGAKKVDQSNPAILRGLWNCKKSWNYTYQWVPIHKLHTWELTDNGIVPSLPNTNQVSFKIYKTTCKTREVSEWVQPLLLAPGQGLVILLIRKNNTELECLLTIKSELGIDGGYLITASLVANPGDPIEEPFYKNGKTICQFLQSDEGGRFYYHESLNRVILVEENIITGDNQYWVPVADLKKILQSSNVASFQLRCISSGILGYLNEGI